MKRTTTTDWGRHALATFALIALLGHLGAEEWQGRTGLEGLAWQSPETMQSSERALVEAMRQPLLAAKDCSRALDLWFAGRAADAKGKRDDAIAVWVEAAGCLANLPDLPAGPSFDAMCKPAVPLMKIEGSGVYLVLTYVVKWKTGADAQHGILLVPERFPQGHRYPLLVYVHDGGAGLPIEDMHWLSEQCRRGYAIFVPGLPGQPVITWTEKVSPAAAIRSAGDAGDVRQAVRHVSSGINACLQLPVIRHNQVTLIGIGRGGTIALLAAAEEPRSAGVIAVDAPRLNPFRLYWDRMMRGSNTWTTWAGFCKRDPKDQLQTMLSESPTHHAGGIHCPVLMILPESERNGSRYLMLQDVVDALATPPKDVATEWIDGQVRDVVQDWTTGAGQAGHRRMMAFLYEHYPPDDGVDAVLNGLDKPDGEAR